MSLLDNEDILIEKTTIDYEVGFPKFLEKLYGTDENSVGFCWENKDVFRNTEYSDGFAIYVTKMPPDLLSYRSGIDDSICNDIFNEANFINFENEFDDEKYSNCWLISFYKKMKNDDYECTKSFVIDNEKIISTKKEAVKVIYHFLLDCKRLKIKKGSNMFNWSDELLTGQFNFLFKIFTREYSRNY